MRGFVLIVRRELQLSCRAPAFWALLVIGCAFVAWRTAVSNGGSGLAAYQARQAIVLGLAVLATLLAGAAAGRDRRQMALELVLTKAVGVSQELVAARFLGVLLSVLGMAVAMLAAASVTQAVLGGGWQPMAYLGALWQALVPLTFACALGFSLSSLFTTPLASSIAAIYWISVPLARAHIASILDMTISQHWTVAAPLAGVLLIITAVFYTRSASGGQGASASGSRLAWVVLPLLLAAGMAVARVVSRGEDALVKADPALMAMSSQTYLEGRRAPGFWLPDSEGRLVALSDFRDRPVVLAFWSPAAPESARALSVLGQLAEQFSDENLACVAVCLERDAGTLSLFKEQTSGRATLLWDRGQHYGRGADWCDSPLAISYDLAEVPTIFLLDRRHAGFVRLQGESGLDRVASSVRDFLRGPRRTDHGPGGAELVTP